MTRGFPFLRWALAAMSTGVSVIPQASLARVLPVQGAMRSTSRYALGPMGSASSTRRMGGFPAVPVIRRMKSPVSPKRESVVWTLLEKMG